MVVLTKHGYSVVYEKYNFLYTASASETPPQHSLVCCVRICGMYIILYARIRVCVCVCVCVFGVEQIVLS